ncbi:TPA: hypothetical protein ACRB0F_001383 [Legionella anisa]|uniref:hypothetical protein n=1 Tax=Legionella anisa TaxID=28082 RepID=UPI00034CB92B|nr:hypothetical protein [Legionella anisa]MCW8423116.1 hypothetical protein [Legionella anisa]
MDLNFLERLMELTIDPKSRRIKNRESEHREFKLKYNPADLPQYIKTLVSFAKFSFCWLAERGLYTGALSII